MNKNCKKGFTIVELIIVIAVIAILAAVLIPTFSNLIKRANVANDTALVRNLNTALAADGAKQHDTMREALAAANAFGYDVSKINAKADGNEILWDSYNDCFVYMDESGINYIPDSQIKGEAGKGAQLWHIVNKGISDISPEYSNYLGEGTYAEPLEVSTGLDVGDHTEVTEVVYNGKGENVIIYMNGGKLTVNESNATAQQYFYGWASQADITTGTSCFHVYGKIGNATVSKGKIIAEKDSAVFVKNAKANTVVEKNGGLVVVDGSVDSSATIAASTEEEKKSIGYTIARKEDLIALREIVNEGTTFEGLTIKLTADLDMTGYEWKTPIGTSENNFKGAFDGQNHKIINLSNNGKKSTEILENFTTGNKGSVFGLFGYLSGNVIIENLEINVNAYLNDSKANGWGAVSATAGKTAKIDLVVKNVVVSGILAGGDKAGGVVGDASTSGDNSTLRFENCINKAIVVGDRAAGIVACTQNAASATFINCKNEGAISSTNSKYSMVAGISSQVSLRSESLNFENCTNAGQLSALVAYNLFTNVNLYKTGEKEYTSTDVGTSIDLIKMYHDRMIGGAYSESTKMDWQIIEKKYGLEGLYAGVEYGVGETYLAEFTKDSNTFKFKTVAEAMKKLGTSHYTDLKVYEDICWKTTFCSGYTVAPDSNWQNSGSFSIDLNGHTLTAESMIMVVNGAKVTFKNGTIVGSESFATDEKNKLFTLTNLSNLTFENVNLDFTGKCIASVESTYVGTLNLIGNTNVKGFVTIIGEPGSTALKLNDTTFTYSENNGYIVINGKTGSQGSQKQ